jgi:AraC family transcriptional regulator of adaptative response / methylphosphotriester-DNA alkyltransferase methyltransferase
MMLTVTPTPSSSVRQREIVQDYLALLDRHIADLKAGHAPSVLEIRDFAEALHVHPRHLSNTIQEVLQCSPCDLFETRLMEVSRDLILNTRMSIADIARHLHYDPSNFGKFFKQYAGVTPRQFREANSKN